MKELTTEIKQRIDTWLNAGIDETTKQTIGTLLRDGNVTELTEAFYKDLEFGTGGLRGIMGVGTNRINRYTVGMATQGFSNYLKKSFNGQPIKVVVAHDNRHQGVELAQVVADVFSANGIHVYFFDSLRPTPLLSFAIRYLACHGGVMLTASHNPKEYNGYKAYWQDGGQLIPPHDKNVIAEVQQIKSIDAVNFDRKEKLIEVIGEAVDNAYLEKIRALAINPEASKTSLAITFSPLHGTGVALIPKALKAFGFSSVFLVEQQCTTDGDFPTVVYPNPEEPEALTLALANARKNQADLVMATDPDADRVGIAVRDETGDYVLLNGNQTATLLIYYVLSQHKKQNKLTGQEYIVKTIVTSYLLDAIAASFGVDCYNVLTGFKYIGEMITSLEGKRKFLAGGEESYGYLIGELVRDKDAVIACCMIAEMTAYYKASGKNLLQVLQDIYQQYGLYHERLISLTKKGKDGLEQIQQVMNKLRQDPPRQLGGIAVVSVKDYLNQIEKNLTTGNTAPTALPKSDVLQFITQDGSLVTARPSGTEPKIKFYCSVRSEYNSQHSLASRLQESDKQIDAIMNDLQAG